MNGQTCFGDATKKLWVMFETVLEPVVVGSESDEEPGWPTVTGDDDFLACGEAQVFGEVVLHFS